MYGGAAKVWSDKRAWRACALQAPLSLAQACPSYWALLCENFPKRLPVKAGVDPKARCVIQSSPSWIERLSSCLNALESRCR